MTPQDIIETINRMFDEAIIVTDVGQHQMFTAQFAEITQKKRLLMSGGLGTMGYGLPGAIGAKIGNPDVPVISISGDGGMQMNIQELATAVLEERSEEHTSEKKEDIEPASHRHRRWK